MMTHQRSQSGDRSVRESTPSTPSFPARRGGEADDPLLEIAERIGDVFYVKEPDDRLSYLSPAAERLWGYVPGELNDWIEAVDPNDRVRVLAAHRSVDPERPCDLEYRIRHPDGSVRWVRDRAFSSPGPDPESKRRVGVVQDVTAEHELAEDLAQAHKMEVIGTLASSVAHDFRNVLHAVSGSLELALADPTLCESVSRYLRIAARAADRGLELTNQLMEFSRKRADGAREITLDELVADASEFLARLVGDHIRLELDLGAGPSAVHGVPIRIEQILLNLTVNAAEAMPAGGRLLVRTRDLTLDQESACRLGLPRPGRYVSLSVEDTGEGMDEETRRRIFEPFFTGKPGRGTGLGLYTVLEATQELDARIQVESEKGRGSTFTLYLPRSEAEAAAKEIPAARPGRLEGTALVVDDDSLARSTTRALLEELGLQVLEASDPEAALQLCEHHRGPIDYAIFDVLMPNLPGPRLAEIVRERLHARSVLLVSARGEADLIGRGLIAPGAEVIRKPFDRDTIAAALLRIREQTEAS